MNHCHDHANAFGKGASLTASKDNPCALNTALHFLHRNHCISERSHFNTVYIYTPLGLDVMQERSCPIGDDSGMCGIQRIGVGRGHGHMGG